jgi:predicted outer membrane protein
VKYFKKLKNSRFNMKKLFIVLAVASLGFVACNNEADVPYEETQGYKDSVAAKVTADSLAAVEAAKAAMDTMPKADTMPK